MIPLALVLAATVAQGEPRPEGRRNPILDGVAVQAGDTLVLLSEFERLTRRFQEQQPPSDREEEEAQKGLVLRELWTWRLEEQKGADLGLDPAQIGRISRANLEAEREREGLEAYLAELREQGKDALSEEADREQLILRLMWEQSAQGRPFGGNRATRDQGLRPGELHAMYEEHKHDLAPVTVQLRWLVVWSAALGGPEEARASCEEARARVMAGEDLALLVEERGAELRDTRGLTPFIPPQAIRDPALRAFAEAAEASDLSEVLPLTNPKTGKPDPGLGYQLAELHERRTPPVPEYSSPEVQRGLREAFLKRRAAVVLGRERDRLRRESYSWVNPLLAGPATATEARRP